MTRMPTKPEAIPVPKTAKQPNRRVRDVIGFIPRAIIF